MRPEGVSGRDTKKSGAYSYEQRKSIWLDAAYCAQFSANQKAWEYFQKMPPSYRGPAIWWVMSAKREETRLSRLATLIERLRPHRARNNLPKETRRSWPALSG